MEVLDYLSAFVKTILLTSILHDDLTVVADQGFLSLSRAADDLSISALAAAIEPWTKSKPNTFLLDAKNFSQYWSDVALFQRNRANVINLCSGLMCFHESRLKRQTCRMYNSDNLNEANDVQSLLQCVHPSSDFTAPNYIQGNFGDFLSHQKLL